MQRIVITAIIILTLSACGTSGRTDYSKPSHKTLQSNAMARWNRCVDAHLSEHSTMKTSAYWVVRGSLKICEGHSQDVLSTYPRRLEKPLSARLEALALEQGFKTLQYHANEKVVLGDAVPELQIKEY